MRCMERLGSDRLAETSHGTARRCKATRGQAGPGVAGLGGAMHGMARRGKALRGKGRKRAAGSPAALCLEWFASSRRFLESPFKLIFHTRSDVFKTWIKSPHCL